MVIIRFTLPRSGIVCVLKNAHSAKHSMLIRRPLWFWHKSQYCHQATHDRTYNIEEAEGQIDQSRYAKHRALRHAACCPRHQYGSDRGRVLGRPTQQFRTIATLGILVVIDRNVHDDRQELVAHNQVEQYARSHRGAYQRGSTLYTCLLYTSPSPRD